MVHEARWVAERRLLLPTLVPMPIVARTIAPMTTLAPPTILAPLTTTMTITMMTATHANDTVAVLEKFIAEYDVPMY